jgi:precorrin-2 methylase
VRKIHVIGIGAGDPEQLTLQAVRALRSTDVFFLLDKGEAKDDLTQLRRDMLDAHIPDPGSYRVVEARDPERDRTGLNRVARPVQITTGRRLSEGFPQGVDDVVVMLDAHQTFRQYAEEDIDIYWGAYIGTPDEILVSGPIGEAGPRIERLRAEARERKGWIMDTYLLRRHPERRHKE